jgi:hypothetical protein
MHSPCLFILIIIPIIPKVMLFHFFGVPILLDDFALAFAVGLGLIHILTRASVTGSCKLMISQAGVLFCAFALYKTIDFGILSLAYPWTDQSRIGHGVIVGEGTLVLSKTLAFVFVYIITFSSLRSWDTIIHALKLHLFSVIIVVVIGLIQLFVLGHGQLTSTFRNIHALSIKVPGWGVDDPWSANVAVGHEHLGAYMVLAVSILGGVLFFGYPANRLKSNMMTILWIACLITLVFASSRGAWIGGACSLMMFAGLALKGGQFSRLLFIVFVSICSLTICEWILDLGIVEHVENRIGGLLSFFSYNYKLEDDSALNRIGVYNTLWGIFKNHFILGLGAGAAGRIAEGQLIRELVEGGVIGGSLFLILMIISGKIAFKTIHTARAPLAQGVSFGFVCGLVGLFGQSFFTELFILTKIGTPFWVMAAIVHRLYTINPPTDTLFYESATVG